ncbi:MAG: portal protein [Dehalococcoidia bacterium]
MSESEVDILATAKKHFEEANSAWSDLHAEMLEDLNFLAGDQWDPTLLADREGKPCLTINKLPAFIDQVVGDQLQNRPQVRFIPVDGSADPDTAEVMTGLFRHVEQQSDAEVAYDTGSDSAVSCGKGAWRVLTEYTDSETFDQEIRIERILNRFSVFPDPLAQKWDYSDGRYMFVVEDIPRETFEATYPDADHSQWDNAEATNDWITPDHVRVAEYFYKKPVSAMLYEIEFQDGTRQIVKTLPDQDQLNPYIEIQKRKTTEDEIWWTKLIGTEILEGPTKVPGRFYPIVLLWGKELVLDKKRIYRGAIRHAKDPQRLYNLSRSWSAERTALAKPSPYFLTPAMIQDHEWMWNNAHLEDRYYMLFNIDPKYAGAPQRQMPGAVDTAVQSEMLVADQEIHDTTGLQQASLGKRSNEKSGIAVMAKQREGDVANYAYTNNLARALKYTGKVFLDLAPIIYDTARIVRILGPDGAEKMVKINQEYMDEKTGGPKFHDFAIGKYDAAVTIGPSYTTQRQESATSMMEIQKTLPPEVAMGTAPIVVKSLDLPGSQEFIERIEKYLPPGIAEDKNQPQQGPPQVDPAQQQQMQMQQQMMQQQQAAAQLQFEQERVKLEQEAAKLEGIKLDNQKKLMDLGKSHQEMVHKEVGMERSMYEGMTWDGTDTGQNF